MFKNILFKTYSATICDITMHVFANSVDSTL